MSTDMKTQIHGYVSQMEEDQAPIDSAEVLALLKPVREVLPKSAPVRRVRPRVSRRWDFRWVYGIVAAAVALLLVGGAVLLFRVTESDTPVASSPTDPSSARIWSRVPHDEAVFGGDGEQKMFGVTVGGLGLVAVGVTDGWLGDGDAAVWTSPDGVRWSRVPHDETVFGGANSQTMWDVTVGGPGLVAVGWDGQGILDDNPDVDAAIWTSVDGVTWSRIPHDEEVFGAAWMNSVTVGGPGLVAVGGTDGYWTDGDAVVWTSVDGLTWSRVPHDETVFGGVDSQVINDVTVGGPGLVAVGQDGGIGPWDNNGDTNAAVWTSVGGINWSRVPHDETVFGTGGNPSMLSVTAGGPGLVAVGADYHPLNAETPVWTSPDGLTWTRVPDDVTVHGSMTGVTAGEPGLVAVGAEGMVWTSVDGITWSRDADDDTVFGSDWVFRVTVGGPGFVAVGGYSDTDAAVWVWGD